MSDLSERFIVIRDENDHLRADRDGLADKVRAYEDAIRALANGGSLHGGPQLRWTVADIRDELRALVDATERPDEYATSVMKVQAGDTFMVKIGSSAIPVSDEAEAAEAWHQWVLDEEPALPPEWWDITRRAVAFGFRAARLAGKDEQP